MSKYQVAAAILLDAYKQIEIVLNSPEDELHLIRLQQLLRRNADYLLLVTGAGDMTTPETVRLGPATTIGGKDIRKLRTFTEADIKASDDKVFQLKQRVQEALPDFYDLDAESLLAITDDVVIRGIAKKLGMKAGKNDVPVVTVDFINSIKEKLPPKERLGEAGQEDEEDDDLIDPASASFPIAGNEPNQNPTNSVADQSPAVPIVTDAAKTGTTAPANVDQNETKGSKSKPGK